MYHGTMGWGWTVHGTQSCSMGLVDPWDPTCGQIVGLSPIWWRYHGKGWTSGYLMGSPCIMGRSMGLVGRPMCIMEQDD